MNRAVRFLQASDLHLERPPRGLADVPDAWRAALIEAPYRAAERVFDAAIKERVDFVVLAGDVVDPLMAGPRALVFLGEQFRKLAERGIMVYWAGGRADDFDRWVEQWGVPDNVVRFSTGRVQRVVHRREGEPVAQILGTSSQQRKAVRAAEFRTDGSELFAVAVAYGQIDSDALTRTGVNYWALGGEHHRRALHSTPAAAHYSGTPQGRRPSENGARGCLLSHVDESLRVRTSFLPTDAVRFQTERLPVTETTTTAQLHETISQRIGQWLGDPFGPDLLVQWVISGSRTLADEIGRGKLPIELTARLRNEFGAKRPAAWTVGIEAETPQQIGAKLYEEDTLLGEFLRTVQHYEENPDAEIDFEPLLAQRYLVGSLGSQVALDDAALRRRVLAEVARLGVQLLGPQEPRS